jgi:hypothetical protein
MGYLGAILKQATYFSSAANIFAGRVVNIFACARRWLSLNVTAPAVC